MKTIARLAPLFIAGAALAATGCSQKNAEESEATETAAAQDEGEAEAADEPAGGDEAFNEVTEEHENPAFVNIPNACYKEGALAGGKPSTEHLEQAAEKGYKTIISFQAPDEEGVEEEMAVAEELGMAFVSIPVTGAEDLTKENAEAFAEALETAERDVMVHCGSGNRVGAMFAIKAHFVDGLSPEEAEQIGYESGMVGMAEDVRKALGLDS